MLIRYFEVALCFLAVSDFAKCENPTGDDFKGVLMCLRREYTLKATRTDSEGRQCWDVIRTVSCWGRCDSFEIPDWRFPYKISIHPVCIHDKKKLKRVQLRNCDPGIDKELRNYEYYEAESCSCGVCNSSDTFCDWKGRITAEHQKQHEHPKHHGHHKHHEKLTLLDIPQEILQMD